MTIQSRMTKTILKIPLRLSLVRNRNRRLRRLLSLLPREPEQFIRMKFFLVVRLHHHRGKKTHPLPTVTVLRIPTLPPCPDNLLQFIRGAKTEIYETHPDGADGYAKKFAYRSGLFFSLSSPESRSRELCHSDMVSESIASRKSCTV